MGGQGTCPSLPKRVRAEPGRQTLLVHFEAEICATCCIGMMINSSFYCTFYYFKNDITKFLWGDLRPSPHNFLAAGAIAPSPPWSRRLWHRHCVYRRVQTRVCTCGAVCRHTTTATTAVRPVCLLLVWSVTLTFMLYMFVANTLNTTVSTCGLFLT